MNNIEKFIKLLKKQEISEIKFFGYEYIKRKKIVTYVPLGYVDKLTFEMGDSGAGKIGNYDLCSFRMKGLGTYRPGKSSSPFKGTAGKLEFAEEIRLEMECSEKDTDEVIESLLKNHPYEEPAYEIYDFTKRTNIPTGAIIRLKKNITVSELIMRMRKGILPENLLFKNKIKDFIITTGETIKNIQETAIENNIKNIFVINRKYIKFNIIK